MHHQKIKMVIVCKSTFFGIIRISDSDISYMLTKID